MRASLFRKEALESQQQPMEGSLLLATSPRATALALVAFSIALCLLIFVSLGEFNRKANVKGYLAPDKGLVKVFPQVMGTLIERRVKDGDWVKKGEILAVVSIERGSLSIPDANGEAIRILQTRLDSFGTELDSQKKLNGLRKQALVRQDKSLAAELEKLEEAIYTIRIRTQNSDQERKRFEGLKSSGFVASSDVYLRQDVSLELRGRLQVLERDRIALLGRQQVIETEMASGELDAQLRQEALKRRILELQQQLAEVQTSSEIVVAAPSGGRVSTVLIQPGQQTRLGVPLLSIIPQGARLEARLLVPSHAIGFITPGQEVALRYEAFPYQRFGHYRGTVDSIARSLLLPGDVESPTPLMSPVYLVTVILDKQSVVAYDKEFALQAGMSLEGDVLLDRRTLLQWMFDPLFSLTKRS